MDTRKLSQQFITLLTKKPRLILVWLQTEILQLWLKKNQLLKPSLFTTIDVNPGHCNSTSVTDNNKGNYLRHAVTPWHCHALTLSRRHAVPLQRLHFVMQTLTFLSHRTIHSGFAWHTNMLTLTLTYTLSIQNTAFITPSTEHCTQITAHKHCTAPYMIY